VRQPSNFVQLTVGRQKQDEVIKDLQRQLKEVRKEFSDYKAEHEEAAAQSAQLAESAEMLTLGTVYAQAQRSHGWLRR